MNMFHFDKAIAALLLLSYNTPVVLSVPLTQGPCDAANRHERTLRGVSRSAQTTTIINNGVIMLGIHDEGHLNVPGSNITDGFTSTDIGLKYFRDGAWFDSTSYGCRCEGFGVSAKVDGGSSFSGYANDDDGVFNLAANPIVSDGLVATTFARVTTGPLSVKHEYAPSSNSMYLYEARVTMENTSGSDTLSEIRYRRTMDWDIPPTIFRECVSIFYSDQPDALEFATDDGFDSSNPLVLSDANGGKRFSCPTGGAPCPVYDSGSADHGANFQFLFKDDDGVALRSLGPGESIEFSIFYGAAPNKVTADAAIGAVGAEVVSYGYSAQNGCNEANDGSPGVYIFGFAGVGANVIFSAPPSTSPEPTPTPTPGKCDVSALEGSTILVPHRRNCYKLLLEVGSPLMIDVNNLGCKGAFESDQDLTLYESSSGNVVYLDGGDHDWSGSIEFVSNVDPGATELEVDERFKNGWNNPISPRSFDVQITLLSDCSIP